MYNKREIMRRAWRIKRNDRLIPFSKALKLSWKREREVVREAKALAEKQAKEQAAKNAWKIGKEKEEIIAELENRIFYINMSDYLSYSDKSLLSELNNELSLLKSA